jgi:hypothetical protein
MSAMQGSCLCGGVRFQLSQPFQKLTFCHCTTCKRISGGVGTANGRARTEWIEVVQGQELITRYQPDEGSAKSFCSICGANLFGGGWPESEECSVRLSAIDGEVAGEPSAHIYARSVASWETLPDDGLPRFAAGSP